MKDRLVLASDVMKLCVQYPIINSEFCEDVMNLPYVKTEGKWVRKKDDRFVCSECGCICGRYGIGTSPLHGNRWNYNFCPNCGADMRGTNENDKWRSAY